MSKRTWIILLVGVLLVLAGGWWVTSGLAGLFPDPPPPLPKGVQRGPELDDAVLFFRECCERCHGRDGTGSPARERMAEIPDFTSGKWQANRTDSQLLASILDGKGDQMPAFRKRADEKQARQLIAYIRVFGPAKKDTGAGKVEDSEARSRRGKK